jgi:hypothetical protein
MFDYMGKTCAPRVRSLSRAAFFLIIRKSGAIDRTRKALEM